MPPRPSCAGTAFRWQALAFRGLCLGRRGLDGGLLDRFRDLLGDDLGRGGDPDLLFPDRDAEQEDEHAEGQDAEEDDDEQGARDLDLPEIFIFHQLYFFSWLLS
jgi:hypothetical protein